MRTQDGTKRVRLGLRLGRDARVGAPHQESGSAEDLIQTKGEEMNRDGIDRAIISRNERGTQ